MKDKKVGDKIYFDYDVYELENNVELVYDHTDTLCGIVTEVMPDEAGGYTKYKVRLIELLYVESESDYELYLHSDTNLLEVRDNKIYRGSGLASILYPNLRMPTKEQIWLIQKFYDHKTGADKSAEYIMANWYKTVLGDLYDEEEFGISKPTTVEGDPKDDTNWDDFWREFKNKIMPK
jgi:hypothetical protein